MLEVYGRSECEYCTMVQKLLEEKKIPYNYIQLGVDITKDQFIEMFPEQKTVPVIVAHGMKLGGYSELVDYVEETSGGYGEDFN